jgi:hypothetical protein
MISATGHAALCHGHRFKACASRNGLLQPGNDADATRLIHFTLIAHELGCPMGLIQLTSNKHGDCECSLDVDGKPIPPGMAPRLPVGMSLGETAD